MQILVAEGTHLAWAIEVQEHNHLLVATTGQIRAIDLLESYEARSLQKDITNLSEIAPSQSFEHAAAMHAALDHVERISASGQFGAAGAPRQSVRSTSVVN